MIMNHKTLSLFFLIYRKFIEIKIYFIHTKRTILKHMYIIKTKHMVRTVSVS